MVPVWGVPVGLVGVDGLMIGLGPGVLQLIADLEKMRGLIRLPGCGTMSWSMISPTCLVVMVVVLMVVPIVLIRLRIPTAMQLLFPVSLQFISLMPVAP